MADVLFPPLEVCALDEMMNRCTGVIPYRSLIWTRRYHEPGEFSMVVPANIYDPSWAYIYTDDRPETGIIQKVEFNDDSQVYGGIDSITVSGFFFESVLNNITFLVEQPDEIKVAIPKPKRPYVLKSQSPKVYTDTVGGYYYTNSSGDMVSAETGEVVTGGGLVELDYKPIFGTGDWDPDTAHSNFDYTVDGDKSHITVVDYNGNINDYPTGPTGTYEVEFITDKGDTFYYNRYGNLTMAFGVANKVGNTYFAQVRDWEAGPKYKIVHVKGPWQRTDTMDTITEGDSVDMLFKWIQNMCGNNMLYEEPEIEGVTKKLDPSFQLLGDLAYSVLKEVGASYRVTYSFQQDVLVFSVYRGLDRTQDQGPEYVEPGDDSGHEPDSTLSGYTQLQYIEGTGTQHVDTGIYPTQDTRIVTNIEILSGNDTNGVLGGRSGVETGSFCLWIVSGYLRTDYGTSQTTTPVSATGSIDVDKDGATTGLNAYSTTQPKTSFTSSKSLTLFAINGGSDGALDPRKFHGRFGRTKIYSGDDMLMDLVPAKRDSDGAVGFLDVKGGSFLGNSGTGSFVAGPAFSDDEPEGDESDLPGGYEPLTFIQSDGTQWVDTGVKPNQGTRVVLDADVMASNGEKSGAHHLFGCNASSGPYFTERLSDSQDGYQIRYGKSALTSVSCSSDVYGRHVFRFGSGYFNIDGGVQTLLKGEDDFSSSLSMYAFCLNSSGNPSGYCDMRMRSMQVYQDGELSMDLRPCVRSYDGAVGLYDIKGKKFVGNSGSGEFIKGDPGESGEPGDGGNPWAVFSDTWGTLTGYSAYKDTSNYRNKCFVLYEYDKPLAFDDTGWPVAGPIYGEGDYLAMPRSYGVQYESKRGYHTNRLDDGDYTDREAYLDLRDEKPSCDNMWSRERVELPGTAGTEQQDAIAQAAEKFARPEGNNVDMRAVYAAYEEDISQNRGPAYLRENFPVETNLDTGTINTRGYMRDWDMGDLVDLEVSTIGLEDTGRIVSVEESYGPEGAEIRIEIGEPITSKTRKVRLV